MELELCVKRTLLLLVAVGFSCRIKTFLVFFNRSLIQPKVGLKRALLYFKYRVRKRE